MTTLNGCEATRKSFDFNIFFVSINIVVYFSEKFGLYNVDVYSADKKRIKKKSADFYRTVIATKEIPQDSFTITK